MKIRMEYEVERITYKAITAASRNTIYAIRYTDKPEVWL